MFRQTSTIRRFFCRASFVWLCFAPTVGVGVWSVAWRLPSHRRGYEQAIGHEIGLDVRLSGVSHPRPGLTLLTGLQATEPETRRVVAQAEQIKAASNGVGLVVVAIGVEVDAEALGEVWNALERTLARRPATPLQPVRIVANELTLRWPDRTEKLLSVAGRIETLDDGPQVRFEWRFPDSSGVKPPQFTLFRDRHGDLPQTGFELDTGDDSLDLSLLSPALNAAQYLGPRARFSGYLWTRRGEQGWSGEARGELAEIDLATLVANRIPHSIRGAAKIQIDDARFVDGRLARASGLLEAGPGFVGQSFLQAVAAALGMTTRARDAEFPRAILPYDNLAVEYSLDETGLSLIGQCRSDLPHAVIVDGRKSLLEAPDEQAQPLAGLAKLFATPGDPVVPLNPFARGLLDLLPPTPTRGNRGVEDRFLRADGIDPPRSLDGSDK